VGRRAGGAVDAIAIMASPEDLAEWIACVRARGMTREGFDSLDAVAQISKWRPGVHAGSPVADCNKVRWALKSMLKTCGVRKM